MTKILVTTALEETWGLDDDYLCFMGEWCTLYSKYEVWSNRRYEILSYHWDDRSKAYKDFKYLQGFNKKLINDLTIILNDIHGKKYSAEVWNILVGYWLIQFTAIVFDRWSMIERAISEHEHLETIVLSVNSQSFIPNDSNEAGRYFIDDKWNHYLCGTLIKRWTRVGIKKTIPVEERCDYLPSSVILNVKRQVKSAFSWIIKFYPQSTDYIFASTHLSLFNRIRLNISLGRKVHYAQNHDTPLVDYDATFRKWDIVNKGYDNKFEFIVRSIISEFMPKTFLEGFQECISKNDTRGYTEVTKVIFTANNHFSNDVFKSFLVEKVDRGAKLVIGQHGGGPFHKYNGATSFELSIADRYLCAGNGNKGRHIVDIGQLFNGKKYHKYNKKGQVLLVTVAMPRYSFDLRSMAIASQMLGYFEDQFKFYNNLTDSIKQQLRVRLYDDDYGWSQKRRWLDRFPDVQFDENKKMDTSVSQSRLFIGTYAATTYNETLASNIPTIVYWNPEHWELSNESDSYFEELKRVGIFHTTPQSAAEQVVKIWGDIDNWWYDSELQRVRERYCRAFAHRPRDLIERIKKTLINEKKGYDDKH